VTARGVSEALDAHPGLWIAGATEGDQPFPRGSVRRVGRSGTSPGGPGGVGRSSVWSVRKSPFDSPDQARTVILRPA
jgi:hypothetical protein